MPRSSLLVCVSKNKSKPSEWVSLWTRSEIPPPFKPTQPRYGNSGAPRSNSFPADTLEGRSGVAACSGCCGPVRVVHRLPYGERCRGKWWRVRRKVYVWSDSLRLWGRRVLQILLYQHQGRMYRRRRRRVILEVVQKRVKRPSCCSRQLPLTQCLTGRLLWTRTEVIRWCSMFSGPLYCIIIGQVLVEARCLALFTCKHQMKAHELLCSTTSRRRPQNWLTDTTPCM